MTLKAMFPQAVDEDLGIGAYKQGIQALKRADRQRVSLARPRDCHGSADIDHALEQAQPESARWDYVVAHGTKLHFIEVHPAMTSNVTEMQHKRRWLDYWLKSAAIGKLEAKRCFHWIASGRVAILPTSRRARQLAESGLKPVRRLSL